MSLNALYIMLTVTIIAFVAAFVISSLRSKKVIESIRVQEKELELMRQKTVRQRHIEHLQRQVSKDGNKGYPGSLVKLKPSKLEF